ncbi:hypothetical protein DDB_G0283103 [Dictyostelium discoideum AX4]|uniref:Right handed beta helix domain-containing protein n=1 Tax=Dictyostelium discoideum TaxID=44689 RepID=Q54RK1_DICDI|nr:hypothetical protein DDB_G0283103 [Dictyostelium discoideum AX4]EAL65881.1 hypothetical protein DDB_G0283103 [Dictyostelium discoideum AX4]|eukprot:XP_639235.1 hypothetical protein DDB_G0283103 [Dictyostelium discoideum AX4]
MLSRKFNIIILLVCVLFVSAIKSSSNLGSSPNANPTILNLIVDSNKINSYSSECGSSFEDSCNNIVDAVKYFHEYNSKPENINSTLVLKLADGTYPGKVNYIHSGLGLNITISTYTSNSNDVIIDGSDIQNYLIDFDNKGDNPPSSKTYLKVSNVAFVNFFSLDYDILHSDTVYGKMETQYIFERCKFLNSTNLRFSGYGESKDVNSISFERSIFENVTFRENSFFSRNYTTSFTLTKFNSVSFDDSFIVEEIDSKKTIFECAFNQVSFGIKTQKLYFIEAKDISIESSTFNQIIGPKSSTPACLLKISNNVNIATITLNSFNNFDGVLVESNKSSISFISNEFSNSNNKPIIKSLNSNVIYELNTFKYSGNSNDDQLIDCTGSSISFTSNNNGSEIFEKNPICKDCFITFGSKTVCSKKTTTTTTSSTSSSITTTGETTHTSTTGDDDHPNGSVDSKYVSYQLLAIILIIISLLNIKIH